MHAILELENMEMQVILELGNTKLLAKFALGNEEIDTAVSKLSYLSVEKYKNASHV